MSYRLYTVGPAGRLQLNRTFDSVDDDAAIEQARDTATAGEALELWRDGQLLGRISKLGVFTPGPPSVAAGG